MNVITRKGLKDSGLAQNESLQTIRTFHVKVMSDTLTLCFNQLTAERRVFPCLIKLQYVPLTSSWLMSVRCNS
jgi:hypothetical protein